MKVIFAKVSKKLHEAFKAACSLNGRSMASVLTELMEKYVKEARGKR